MKALGMSFIAKPLTSPIQVRWMSPPDMVILRLILMVVQCKDFCKGARSTEILWVLLRQFLPARKMGAYEAEILAAFEGIAAALMKGWTKLLLQSDSTYVVSLFQVNPPWKYRSFWQ